MNIFKTFFGSKKALFFTLFFFFIIYLGVALYYSRLPSFEDRSVKSLKGVKVPRLVLTIRFLIEDEYDFSWLPNDTIFFPTVILDNRPNFQKGVLTILRHSMRILRDNLTRNRTTDQINEDIAKAFSLISNDETKFILPSFESIISKFLDRLEGYEEDMKADNANFFPRSDNLIQLLEQYISELGNLNTRLLSDNIGFFEIDDLFFYSYGICYAIYHIVDAIKIDFNSVISEKRATPLIKELQKRLLQAGFRPFMVVSGDSGSMLANHLMQLAGITADSRQKMKSLSVMLDKN